MRDFTLFLPSKRFAFTAGALLFALVLALGASYLGERKSRGESGLFAQNGNVVTKEASGRAETDADADGLKDWEEALWGTDPNNLDTDQDGAKDGEEVRMNRNPSVAGPNDLLPPQLSGGGGENAEDGNILDTSKTAFLGRELYATALSLKQSGASAQTIAERSEGLVETFTAGTRQEPAYTLEQLKVSGDHSEAALRVYGNAVSGVIIRYAAQIKESEFEIMGRAMETGDKKEIEKLAPLVGIYGSASRDIVSVTVPSEIAEAHLMLANSYAGMAQALVYMGQVLDDPVVGLAGLAQSQYYGDMIDTATRDMQTFFLTNRIVFNAKEKGSIFTSIK